MWKWFIFIINANICIQKRHIKTARRQNFLIFKDILLETCRWLCDIFTDKYGFMKIVPPGVTIWLWDLTTLEYKHSPHLSGWGREVTVQSWRDFCLFVVACLRQTGHFISFIERAEDAEHRTVLVWKTKLYCCSPRESGWLVSTVKTFIQPQNKNNYRDTQIVKIVAYPSQFDMFTLSAVFIGKARSHF